MYGIKRRRRVDKKGSIQDFPLIAAAILFFGIVVLIGFKMTNSVNDQIQPMSSVPAEAKTAVSTINNHFPGVIDNSFLLLTVGLALGVLALAALVRVHPIFIPMYFIALIIVIILSGVLSNIYQEMAANPNLAAEAAQLTMITQVLTYLPFIIGVFGTLLMVVMYKTWKSSVTGV